MRIHKVILGAFLVGCAPTVAVAQKTFTLPAKGVQPREGMGLGLVFPAPKLLPARQQCMYPTTDLPATPILIREVAFQPNAPQRFGLEAAVYTLTLDMSIGPLAPRKFSRTFANNLGKVVTRVFSGKLQLPKITSSTSQGWHCRIPLQRPFVADRKIGPTLVLDFTTTTVITKMTWRWELLQGLQDTGSGKFQGIGFNCHFKKINILWQSFPGSVYVGSRWGWTAGPLLANQPGFLTIGDAGWGSRWAGFTLPINLTPVGAPGCTWDLRPILSIPFVVNSQGLAFVTGLQIPNDARLANSKFFMQGAYAYPGANALGFLFLPSFELRIGTGEDTNAASLGWPNNSPPMKLGISLLNNPAPYCRMTY